MSVDTRWMRHLMFSFLVGAVCAMGSTTLRAAESTSQSKEDARSVASDDDSDDRAFPSDPATSSSSAPSDQRSSGASQTGRIFGELGMGLVGFAAGGASIGLGAYGLCRWAVDDPETIRGESSTDRCLAAAAFFGGPAAFAGYPTGVWLGGQWLGGQGRVWAPYVGLLAGMVLSGSVASVIESNLVAGITLGTTLLAGPIVAYEWSHAREVEQTQSRPRQVQLPLSPFASFDRRGRFQFGLQGHF